MIVATVLAPLLLAVVFVVSGVVKLRDPQGVDTAFETLDVPASLRTPLVRRSFPWVEIALGVLLLLCPWWLNVLVALAALALTVAYLWLIWSASRKPEPVDCHCFGGLTQGRVTGLTVARNVTLVLLGLVAVVDAFLGTVLVRLYDFRVLQWIVGLLVAGWLAYTILGDREGRPGAQAAPAASGGGAASDLTETADDDEYVRQPIPYGSLGDGDKIVTLRELAREQAVLLVWVSLTCGSCKPVIEQLPGWRKTLAGRVDVRPVLRNVDGLAETHPDLAEGALRDPDGNTQRLLDAWGNPMAVLLGADGLLAGGPVLGSAAIEDLVEGIQEQLAEAEAVSDAAEVDAPANATPAVPEMSGLDPADEFQLHGATRVDPGADR